MNKVEESLPVPQSLCYVSTLPHLHKVKPYVFVMCSDGNFHWDNLTDEILQSNEVIAWSYCND